MPELELDWKELPYESANWTDYGLGEYAERIARNAENGIAALFKLLQKQSERIDLLEVEISAFRRKAGTVNTELQQRKIKVLENHDFTVQVTPTGFHIFDNADADGWNIISTVPNDFDKCLDETLVNFELEDQV